MKTSDFDYNLPVEQIAQKPIEPRDSSKLMFLNKKEKQIKHKKFSDILDHLQKGDLLVWNNSKVFKARLFGEIVSATGRELRGEHVSVEIFLVRPMENPGVWKVLAGPRKRLGNGDKIVFANDFHCDVVAKKTDGTVLVQFQEDEQGVRNKANLYGNVPLPPYIKDEKHQLDTYQTVYADDTHEGSVAAPTAGFHFTAELIEKLKEKGVEFAEVCLHVGLGTFLPVKSENIEDHQMHSEWVELTQENAEKIVKAKEEGRRVIAVGTTSVRTLEGIAKLPNRKNLVGSYSGDIDIFIKSGFEFQVIDAMITNFHLPKSTLLMLVSAFVDDREFTLDCYQKAVEENYRFYSFGDAMFIYS